MGDQGHVFPKASSNFWKPRAYIYAQEYWIVSWCSKTNPNKYCAKSKWIRIGTVSSLIAYKIVVDAKSINKIRPVHLYVPK